MNSVDGRSLSAYRSMATKRVYHDGIRSHLRPHKIYHNLNRILGHDTLKQMQRKISYLTQTVIHRSRILRNEGNHQIHLILTQDNSQLLF